MPLYRAVPHANFDPDREYRREVTLRAPSNVPYVVDNVWECLRPEDMPSRRHAVYASPTPELALANASAGDQDRNAYVVCELLLQGEFRVAQLDVTDARHHVDVRAVQRAVMARLRANFSALPLTERAVLAPLFMPYLRREELRRLADTSARARDCLEAATEVSTFWASASHYVDADSAGEVFVEHVDGASLYTLQPL